VAILKKFSIMPSVYNLHDRDAQGIKYCVAVCCSVLQCVAGGAVCCSVLQCVAVCCSVLQCVGTCTIAIRKV